jgi:hypothetical protein
MGTMDNLTPSIAEEIADVKFGRPHVVILGAGASLAAFPHGDGNRVRLPLMADFVEIVGIEKMLRSAKIDYQGINFEEVYSRLSEKPEYASLIQDIEATTYSYFSRMRLPASPTIYDHLILSLREKDLIATFNWDPFLYFACLRNYRFAKLPHCVYLHGSVAVGYCLAHKKKGMIGHSCSVCQQPFDKSRLLFPVLSKNYSTDQFIAGEWQTLRNYLKSAYIVTIFGYSAPQSDVEAINLMKEAWGEVEKRNLEEFEIIDIKKASDLANTWKEFIHSHHYITSENFYDSHIARHPRRSCEAMWNQLMECKFLQDNPLPREMSLDEFYGWMRPLLEAEANKTK